MSEDYVLAYSDLLEEYVNQTSMRWEPEARSEAYRDQLMSELGSGILSFLSSQLEPGKRLICTTPRPYNIEKIYRLFPEALLLVLIRDGRDVVDSAVRTWPNRFMPFARSTRTWARGAQTVLKFIDKNSRLRGEAWELVKYEDLVLRPEETVSGILRFLKIRIENFDLAQIRKLPLWGSSEQRGRKGRVHWEPVEKPKEFQPIGRWKKWGLWRRLVFDAVGGRELAALGYVEHPHA